MWLARKLSVAVRQHGGVSTEWDSAVANYRFVWLLPDGPASSSEALLVIVPDYDDPKRLVLTDQIVSADLLVLDDFP